MGGYQNDPNCGGTTSYDLFMDPKYQYVIDHIQMLVKARKNMINYFYYGEFIRPGIFNPTPHIFEVNYKKYKPTTESRGPFATISSFSWINQN